MLLPPARLHVHLHSQKQWKGFKAKEITESSNTEVSIQQEASNEGRKKNKKKAIAFFKKKKKNPCLQLTNFCFCLFVLLWFNRRVWGKDIVTELVAVLWQDQTKLRTDSLPHTFSKDLLTRHSPPLESHCLLWVGLLGLSRRPRWLS